MAQRKRGPGRPKVTVSRNEVWHTPESLKDLERWQALCEEEGNHGAAIRRALAVLNWMRKHVDASYMRAALEETKP